MKNILSNYVYESRILSSLEYFTYIEKQAKQLQLKAHLMFIWCDLFAYIFFSRLFSLFSI
jgi:hypothetical protein